MTTAISPRVSKAVVTLGECVSRQVNERSARYVKGQLINGRHVHTRTYGLQALCSFIQSAHFSMFKRCNCKKCFSKTNAASSDLCYFLPHCYEAQEVAPERNNTPTSNGPPPMKCTLYYELLMESRRAKFNYILVCGDMRSYLSPPSCFAEPSTVQCCRFHFLQMVQLGAIELCS